MTSFLLGALPKQVIPNPMLLSMTHAWTKGRFLSIIKKRSDTALPIRFGFEQIIRALHLVLAREADDVFWVDKRHLLLGLSRLECARNVLSPSERLKHICNGLDRSIKAGAKAHK